MTKVLNFIKRKKYWLVALLVIALLAVVVFKNKNTEVGYVVGRTDVRQSVVLSGKVETSAKADLGFAVSGRVERIYVKNNQDVERGAVLAQLEIGELLADLKIKELDSKTSDVDLVGAKDELEKVKLQEDAKVANAYRNLLSEDLELIPHSSDYIATAPNILGIYDGAEGTYKINISQENLTYILRTFNLEKTKREINEESATLFGTRGLYISFPDDFGDYVSTTWYLNIPNKSGASYLANYNAYIEAKGDRDIKIKNAQVSYDKLLAQEGSGDSVALAEIEKIKAEIRKNTIYAPFSGKVTNIEKEIGENISSGERMLSVLGEERFEVVLQVSELDVSKLTLDSEVKIILDAIPGETFYGILRSVNSKETEVDGVPVYEAFVELAPDPRIKTGMSARGEIVLAERLGVIAIPAYLIQKEGDINFVKIAGTNGDSSGDMTKVEITTGITGSDSMVEITSGLSEGDKVFAGE
ncbi:hypothetical protein A2914_01650 [Candidatus Nomurabacteria bacterium RIFCSPLOWO2_01_FULL_41_21]|uniref:Multidrug resistance protein MdtA-like barrel-sandwich hybrid domain-containing protein n=2 Tax=Candidatus Nomuraibacteriota TaxID=1752729 RepID=A0A1F6V268_9BACT|nr:MAG: hypothetical protein A2733_00560 [Candidatus Nomurabacteria bacterium RIFCSPHIGHO2_01_FULL_40_20]OGI88024.1 MAG: hypothetical protein A2914_01650 [Candidatus Nomurabacteria bacterium RIFCSPLOWO2_01_FULL_41_21]